MFKAFRWVAFLGLATALPLAALAQSSLVFQPVTTWPVNQGIGAADYRRGTFTGVAVDPQGRVFMCHGLAHPVLVFDHAGNFIQSFGEGLFNEPHSVRIDPAGNVWVVDFMTNQVRKFTPTGALLQTFGVRDKAGRDKANLFNQPTDIAFGRNGEIYISDGYGNNRVVHLAADGTYLNEWGTSGKGPGQFHLPHSVCTDAQGRVYVADRENGRIQVFTPDGAFITMWKFKEKPWGVWVGTDQRLYVANGYNNTLSVLDLNGNLLAHFGKKGHKLGQFEEPHLLTEDTNGAVYVAEVNEHRVQKLVRQ